MFGKLFSKKSHRVKKLKSDLLQQYLLQDKTANEEKPDYHILMLLVKQLSINGVSYTVSEDDEKIFYAASENFRRSVQCFSCNNVNIILHIKEISENVNIYGGSRNYLIFEDLSSYLDKFFSEVPFDAVIAASAQCGYVGAVTTLSMFQWKTPCYGFTHSVIVSDDKRLLGITQPPSYPYLVTTNFFIHEWLHQLEGYRKELYGIIYPFTHVYTSDYHDACEDWQFRDNYSWDKEYFSDREKYPYIAEPYITSFYRAVLSCEVIYKTPDMSEGRYVGMYPLFWKLTPRII